MRQPTVKPSRTRRADEWGSVRAPSARARPRVAATGREEGFGGQACPRHHGPSLAVPTSSAARGLSWPPLELMGSPPPLLFLSARDSQLSFSLPFESFPFFSPNFGAPQPTCSLSIFSCFPCAALLRDLRLERLSGVACVAPGGTSSLVDSRMVHPQSSDLTAANSCLKSPFSLSFPQAASLKDKWGLGYKPSYNRSKTITASGRPPLKRMERAR